jgi:nicotinamidase-related amidase
VNSSRTVANTTPYAWPFDGVIDPACTALVLAGCDAFSAVRTPGDPAAAANIEALRQHLATAGVLVVLVHHPLPPTHGAPTTPATPSTPLGVRDGELIITAAGLDGFYGSALDATLRRNGRTHLLLAGLGFETAVHSTLRRANDRGYECVTVADACACGDPDLRHASISSIEMSGGIFGAIGATADVLAAYPI